MKRKGRGLKKKEDGSQMEDCFSFFNPFRCCLSSLFLKSLLTCCFVLCRTMAFCPQWKLLIIMNKKEENCVCLFALKSLVYNLLSVPTALLWFGDEKK
jgi:hypothetical protein